MKVLALILTTTACLAAAVVLFFGIILGMNGFSGSDAEYGLVTYVALAVLISILAGGGAYALAAKLMAREFHPAVSLLISIPVSTIVGVVLLALCVWLGTLFPIALPRDTWIPILLLYALVAATLPVWLLLQPRDYLNRLPLSL